MFYNGKNINNFNTKKKLKIESLQIGRSRYFIVTTTISNIDDSLVGIKYQQ